MYCRRCGRENRENARFCVGCGSSLTDGSAVREMSEVPGKRRKAKKKRKGKIRKFLIITLIIMAAAAIFTAFWFLYRQDRWKEVYISYIESEYRVNGLDEDAVYFLINVDGDEIPELYIYYANLDMEKNSVLCSYYDGSVIEC